MSKKKVVYTGNNRLFTGVGESNVHKNASPMEQAAAALMDKLEKSKKAEKEAKEHNSKFQSALGEQILAFSKDKSNYHEYDCIDLYGDYVLVRLFMFDVGEEDSLKSSFLVPTKSGDLLPYSQAMHTKKYPFVMAIRKGSGCSNKDIEEGHLYHVPYDDVMGESFNPDFIQLASSMQMKGVENISNPYGIPEKVSNLEKDWKRYIFKRPWMIDPEEGIDDMTYYIPTSKIKGKVDVDKLKEVSDGVAKELKKKRT